MVTVFAVVLGASAASANTLPEGRVYEQVSPSDKAGTGVEGQSSKAPFVHTLYSSVSASVNGEAVWFAANSAFAGAPSFCGASSPNDYIARRGSSSWATTTADLPSPVVSGFKETCPKLIGLSPDLSQVFYEVGNPNVPPDSEGNFSGYDLQSVDANGVAERFTGDIQSQSVRDSIGLLGAEAGHVVFSIGVPLLSSDPLPAIGGGATSLRLYEWFKGELHLVSPPGLPVRAGAAIGPGIAATGLNALSADGAHVFYDAVAPSDRQAHPFATIDGQSPQELDISQRSVPGGVPAGSPSPVGARFVAASKNGGIAYFESSSQLTNHATEEGGLYRYESSSGSLSFITPTEPGVTTGARVSRVWGVSDDGEVLYFVASAALAEGATAGVSNLYVYDHGVVRFIAPQVDPVSGLNVNVPGNLAQTSSSGNRFFFVSAADLSTQTGADVRDAVTGAIDPEVYLYEASSGTITCVSCRPDGARPTAGVYAFGAAGSTRQNITEPRWITADGSRAFFMTRERLTSGDGNKSADVYEWRDGRIYLISSGESGQDTTFGDVTPDGRDVFFTTFASLVSSDRDSAPDVYDARIGGGFPEAPRSCAGEQCQGQMALPTASGTAASSTFVGPPDRRPAARRKVQRQHRHGKHGKAHRHGGRHARPKGAHK